MRIQTLGAALAASALLGTAGCSGEATGFPPGVEPLEVPSDAPSEWPAWPTTAGTVEVISASRVASGSLPAYFWAHGRALLAAPIQDVWNALQWQTGPLVAVFPDVPTVECLPANAVETGYDASYSIRETPVGGKLYQMNWFLVNWRANATRDAAQAVQKVNVKAQKVDGTPYILLMRESVVITPAPGGGTQLEIVRHINARDESTVTAADWIRLWVQALDAQVQGTREALIPSTYCFP